MKRIVFSLIAVLGLVALTAEPAKACPPGVGAAFMQQQFLLGGGLATGGCGLNAGFVTGVDPAVALLLSGTGFNNGFFGNGFLGTGFVGNRGFFGGRGFRGGFGGRGVLTPGFTGRGFHR